MKKHKFPDTVENTLRKSPIPLAVYQQTAGISVQQAASAG
jgi:hypothetical protein